MNTAVWIVAGLLGATVVVLAVAVRRRDGAAVVNTTASLGVACVAVTVAAGFDVGAASFVVPELAVWTAVAGLLHSLGMLGPYDSVWWWDHVTHTVSAALLAALVYAGVLVTVGQSWSPVVVAAATVGYTFAAGGCWELLELVARAVGDRYDIDPVLVHYGWRDTALDLVFDVVGAVAVVAVDGRWFVPLAEAAPGATRLGLVWSTTAFFVVFALGAGWSLLRVRR